MEATVITIGRLKQQLSPQAVCYAENLILTDHVERFDLFRLPCRIDATVVLFCLEGEMELSINLKPYRLTRNMLVVGLSRDIVQIQRTRNLRAYVILISTDYLNDLRIDFRQRSDFYLHIHRSSIASIPREEMEALAPYYTLLHNNITRWTDESPEILRGLVTAFSYTIIHLCRMLPEAAPDDGTGQAHPTRSSRLFDKFMSLLMAHHHEHRDATFYASRLCLTANYLSGVVKEYSGKTLTQWISEYVTIEAKLMLLHTDLSIQEIAYRLHFCSQSAFGKYFKQQTGRSPKLYRTDMRSPGLQRGQAQP